MKKVAIALIVSSSLLFGVSPAHAVAPVLPAGDQLFESNCDDGANDHQLFSLDFVAGTRDPIGNGTGGNTLNNCATQGAILPGTDWFYYGDYEGQLRRVDLDSGLVEPVATITGNTADVYALTIGPDGSAYAIDSPGAGGLNLYLLDLSSGVLTPFGPLVGPSLGVFGAAYGFAYDGVTEKYYIAESEGATLVELDMDTLTLTSVGSTGSYWIGSMAFDSDGNLWINGSYDEVNQLTLANVGTTANWSIGDTWDRTDYSESLVIRLAPVEEEEGLADTGSADATPYLLGGLLAAGIALVIRRRRV